MLSPRGRRLRASDQALSTAREALGSDQTEFGVARGTLQTACALVSMGG